MYQKETRRGFTLIELLVVIAIIAILASILFPVFAQVREKARSISCMSNMKQIGLGVMQYVQDYDEAFPFAIDDTNGNQWNSGLVNHWQGAIVPYIKANGVFACPDDPGAGQPVHPIPGNPWSIGIACSYGANAIIGWNSQVSPGLWGVFGRTQMIKDKVYGTATLAVVTRPSESIMIAEQYHSDIVASGDTIGNTTAFGTTGLFEAPWFKSNPGYGDPNKKFPDGIDGINSAHHGGKTMSNYLFIDGHVKSMRPIQTNPNPPTGWDSNGNAVSNMWNATRL